MPIHDWTKVEPAIFHDLQLDWILAIKRLLNKGLLPRNHYALIEPRASEPPPKYSAATDDSVAPSQVERDGCALTPSTDPPKVQFHIKLDDARSYALKANRIVVRHENGHRLVAVIEIISLGDKTSARTVEDFVQRAWRQIESGIHLLILDVFPPTEYVPKSIHDLIWGQGEIPIERDAGGNLTFASYVAGRLPEAFVEVPCIGRALPDMPLFLSPDHYVSIPVEKAYTIAFDAMNDHCRERIIASS